ncbi:MAG: glyoxalase [Rhodobiaceae bacterium]|nr:glyoxalase [Rhodobiaceae bacterium]MBJ66183.1 glyoxalase [Rhodobiaceae bacterium]
MFSHVMVGANDIEESKVFYDNLLGVLGAQPGIPVPNLTGQQRYFYFLDDATFCISEPIDGNPATSANGATIGFNVKDEEQGNAWHKAGIENGGTSIEDPPGVREYDEVKIFLAYLRDPSGNKLCGLLRL